MSTTTEILYLTIERRKRSWKGLRVAAVAKHRPTIKIGQALVKLIVNLPTGALEPPVCSVEIKPEHIAPASVQISSVQP